MKTVGLCATTSIGIGAFSIWALSWDAGIFLFFLGVTLFYGVYQLLNMFISAVSAVMVRQSPSLTTAGLVVLTLASLFFGLVSYWVWTWYEWAGVDEFFKLFAVTVISVRGIQGIVYGALFMAKEVE